MGAVYKARAASALQHPEIVTIHEIGEAEVVDGIVMKYVDGEGLEKRSAPGRDGRRNLPLDDALRIGSVVPGRQLALLPLPERRTDRGPGAAARFGEQAAARRTVPGHAP